MTQSVLEVTNLEKTFRAYTSEWRRVVSWFGVALEPSEQITVIEDISFSITPGQAIGLVGQNGAGKSTLLKLITGTLAPTGGAVNANGRISAILELGLGFNPELTGRQNAAHSAGLMGFSQDAIRDLLPSIEEFAEIGDYFDQPMRTYSSGMQMRVAFSVATCVRPEILIVDEALSVGDAYFQHKSFERIRSYQQQGTALLLVSHDRTAVQALCGRALLLDGGRVISDGLPEEVFDYYNAIIADKEKNTIAVNKLSTGKMQTVSGTQEVQVTHINLYDDSGASLDYAVVGEYVEIRIRIRVNRNLDSIVLGYGIRDHLGQIMYGTNTWHTGNVIWNAKSGDQYEYRLGFNVHLGVGSYSLQTALVNGETHLSANYEWRDMALLFEVVNQDKVKFQGCVWNEPSIMFRRIEQ